MSPIKRKVEIYWLPIPNFLLPRLEEGIFGTALNFVRMYS